MSNLSNSEIIQKVIDSLVIKIGRRTSEGYAVVILDTVINNLTPKYDFLKYVSINKKLYSEGINAVSVSPEIDKVNINDFYIAIKEVLELIIRHLEKKADFFFIREFQESISDIKELNLNLDLKEKGLDLSLMQFKYIVDKKRELKKKHSEVVENVIRALSVVMNKKLPESETIHTIIRTKNRLENEYSFLEYIKISNTPNKQGFYTIDALPDIDKVPSVLIVKSIMDLILEVGKKLEWDFKTSFIASFKNEVGEKPLSKLISLGVDFENIQRSLDGVYEKFLFEVFKALIDIIEQKTSKGFALVTLSTIVNDLKDKYNILKYVNFDKSRYSDGLDSINISSEINSVESYQLAKGIQEIVKLTKINLGDDASYNFIEEFKSKIGKENLKFMDELGVNLHILEMKFAKKRMSSSKTLETNWLTK